MRRSPEMALVRKMLKGDRIALSRLMTLVEERDESLAAIMEEIHRRTGGAHRIGVTGPPGAGKSTLIDKLIGAFRNQKKTVGVVAVDPSSPFSGGAVLGDRVRMRSHALDAGVFIRSFGSRGSHGGLSQATRDAVSLLDAFGQDIIIMETVGVGQTELDIASQADTTIVVLVPESGDTIQAMKAGLMEIADIFVVNKADREGAEDVAGELKSMVDLSPRGGWTVPVLVLQASAGTGVDGLVTQIRRHGEYLGEGGVGASRRTKWRRQEFLDLLLDGLKKGLTLHDRGGRLSRYYAQLDSGTLSPYAAAKRALRDKMLFPGDRTRQ